MSNKIFGTDGIRGRIGSEHINHEAFFDMGVTLACTMPEMSDVVIGHDSRESGRSLAEAVASGVTAAHCRPILLDIASSPSIAYLSERLGGGVAVTASHNGAADNGFKPFLWGDKLHEEQITDFEEHYQRLREQGSKRRLLSGAQSNPMILDTYRNRLEESFEFGSLAGKTVVLDCANGATSELAPEFFRAHLGATVIEYATDPRGLINAGVGAAHPEGLRKKIAAQVMKSPYATRPDQRFLGGFSFDGDGDRVIGVSPAGNVVDGNHWMSLLAKGEDGIVGTLYTNNGLRNALADRKVAFHECANGDSNVTKRLCELGLSKGGEFSGHLIDLDHISSGDGLYMAARMATLLASEGRTLQDVFEELSLWTEHMTKVQINKNAAAELTSDVIQETVRQELGTSLGEEIDVVVRQSGTEPILRIWVQSERQGAAENVAKILQRAFTRLSN